MGNLIYLNKRNIPKSIGNKATNIRKLADIGARIPKTYVVSWDAYRRYLDDDITLVDKLRLELSKTLDSNKFFSTVHLRRQDRNESGKLV